MFDARVRPLSTREIPVVRHRPGSVRVGADVSEVTQILGANDAQVVSFGIGTWLASSAKANWLGIRPEGWRCDEELC